jgi:DNA-binding NtrC family response regulator
MERSTETAQAARIAVIDDDAMTRLMLRSWFEQAGYEVVEHATASSALEAPAFVHAACVDLGLDDLDGTELIRQLRARDPDLQVVVVTAAKDLDAAVGAMRAGAYDYVTKPVARERLLASLARALERRTLVERVSRLESELGQSRAFARLVGESAAFRALADQLRRVLQSDVTVCLFGESGTGKELVARSLHDAGRRKEGAFVAVNCAAIPEALQESELFGHERGAFTGAVAAKKGYFEQARGGTLFLDELAELSASAQASLLRALQERVIRRVGGTAEIPIDVRVVAATHRDLKSLMESGRFRQDLYFRLVVYPITVPPLRERSEDVPLLVGHFLRKHEADVGHAIRRLTQEALDALMRYAWPGNVRELSNVVHRAMLTADGDEIRLADLPREVQDRYLGRTEVVPAPRLGALDSAPRVAAAASVAAAEDSLVGHAGVAIPSPLRELELSAIRQAVDVAGGNIAKAARMLGIGRATIYRRLGRPERST